MFCLCAINLKNISFCIFVLFFACAYYKIEGSAPSSKPPLVMSRQAFELTTVYTVLTGGANDSKPIPALK